jgi:hypothetical protein
VSWSADRHGCFWFGEVVVVYVWCKTWIERTSGSDDDESIVASKATMVAPCSDF